MAPASAEIVSLLSKQRKLQNDKTPNGACHFFVAIDDNWGVKFRQSCWPQQVEENRKWIKYSMQKQKQAYDAGLAPEVGEMVEINLPNSIYVGYVTQRVETVDGGKQNYIDYSASNEYYPDEYSDFIKFYRENKTELELNLSIAGVPTGDMKAANCGRMNGKLVYIDFGPESC